MAGRARASNDTRFSCPLRQKSASAPFNTRSSGQNVATGRNARSRTPLPHRTTKRAIILAALIALPAMESAAHAQTLAHNHLRRVEVNSRLDRQNARSHQGVVDGQLSHAQARQLHAVDRSIRMEERAEAAVNNRHITRGEQQQINAQDNANSAAIYRERH